MKQIDLIRKIEEAGCSFDTAGNTIGISTLRPEYPQPVPRHKEVNEFLAKHILKKLAN